MAVFLSQALGAKGENQAGYRAADYQEDHNRISVETQSGLFEVHPLPWLSLNGEVVYDVVSGFSPTGAPPPSTMHFLPDPNGNPPPGASSTSVPTSHMHDIRWAGSMGATLSLGRQRFTPLFSYSEEHDYRSTGLALNYSLDLNEKNTTLNLGWSHDFDEVLPNGFLHDHPQNKDADDVLVGVNQLLGPKTVLTANLAFGRARGYLNDQYKGVLFDNEPQADPSSPALEAENRPKERNKGIAFVSLTQDVTPLAASVEGSYRFMYDSYSIKAHTVQLGWFQKIGKYAILSPFVRYYYQTAADFYATRFPDFDTRPAHYSADYRLSELETWAVGVNLNLKLKEWLWIDLSYQRYVMKGLDGVTASSAYPEANITTIGARLWF